MRRYSIIALSAVMAFVMYLSVGVCAGADSIDANIISDIDSYELLERINNSVNWREFECIIYEYADLLGIDLTKYNSLTSSGRNSVLRKLAGNHYSDLSQFKKLFDKAVDNALASSSQSSGSNSGSGGGGSSKTLFSIEPITYENGILTANITVAQELSESDTLYAAIYDESDNTLITAAQIDFCKYSSEDGYRSFALQIPCDSQGDITVKLIGFTSMETLKPIVF